MNSPHFTSILSLLSVSCFAGPVINADFEQNLAPNWVLKDVLPENPQAIPITAGIIRINTDQPPGSNGAWSLKITGRDHLQDGAKQNITTALASNGNGQTYTTRFWVKIDPTGADASVRAVLRWHDNGIAQIPIILAEVVVEESGSWVEVMSTVKLQWIHSLTNALLVFEVEQVHRGNVYPSAPTSFPIFYIDDLAMELDVDGDGLFDSEESSDHEQGTISFSDVADSDGDGMEDDWERCYQLNARDSSDAATDLDNDGFTNAEEYFAATDPTSADSYPGKPSDPEATFLTRALLRYLALRPSRKQMLVGQMVSDNSTEYTSYVSNLAGQPGGKWVSMLGLAVEALTQPLDIQASIDHAIPFTNAGGIVQVKWAMWNPWRYQLYGTDPANPQLGAVGDLHKVDIPGLLDPAGTPTINTNTAQENLDARAAMDGWIDTVAAEIQRFNAATGGQPMLFRPLSEMNGGWFWWGHRTRAEYLGLWNHIRNRMIHVHGLHNLIWVYESASSEHAHSGVSSPATASDYYYPGDAAVDVFTHNLYDEDWVLNFPANKIYARHPKIYGVPQAGPGKAYPYRAGEFSNMTYPDQIAALYPRMSFFIVWNSFDSHLDDDNNPNTPDTNDDPFPGTPDNKHQFIAIFDNPDANLLLADSRVITREELTWLPATGPISSTLSSTSLALGWTPALNFTPAPTPDGYLLETSPDGQPGTWAIAQTTGAGANLAAATGLTANMGRWLRVRAVYGTDDTLPTDPVYGSTWTLFQQWKNNLLGDFNAEALGDPDSDGTATLLEYALGTHPGLPDDVQKPVPGSVHLSGEDYLTLTFRRNTAAVDLTFAVKCSDDLLEWNADVVLLSLPIDNGDGTETVTYRDVFPVSTFPKRFMRLEVDGM